MVAEPVCQLLYCETAHGENENANLELVPQWQRAEAAPWVLDEMEDQVKDVQGLVMWAKHALATTRWPGS